MYLFLAPVLDVNPDRCGVGYTTWKETQAEGTRKQNRTKKRIHPLPVDTAPHIEQFQGSRLRTPRKYETSNYPTKPLSVPFFLLLGPIT